MSGAELEALLRAAPPIAPDRLRARVRELRQEPRRVARPSVPRNKLLLTLAGAVLVVAVGAALVHGLRAPSSSRQAASPRPATTVLQAHTAGSMSTRPSSSGFAPARVPPLGGGSRLTQEVASLRLRVDGADKLSQATAQATRIVRALGGYAASVQYVSPAGRPAQAFLELRVPTVRVQAALARLSGLGTILSQRLSARDLENQLERQTAQIAQLRLRIRLTLAALRNPALSPVDRIRLQLELNAARVALDQRLHARKHTIAAGTTARVSLVLTSAQPAQAAPHRSRLHRMLGSAASFLALEGTIALYALVVLSPLVPLALVVWGAAWARRRRDERQLLGAA